MIKLGIVMDPISSINIKKDSSFAMMLEAQRRGYEIHYMEMNDLHLDQGVAIADTKVVELKEDPNGWYEFKSEQTIALADLDAVLMRKDPPFDTEYIYATYILERAEENGALIVNKPQSLRDCNEKLFTAWFPELTPTTIVTRKAEKIKEFREKHGDVILKPLDGMGGASIFRVKEGDPNPELNTRLRAVIQNAKAANMPKDNIERAIKKASEAGESQEVVYEAYGPGGVGIIITGLTDNTNRISAEIKHTLSKNNGSLGTPGSVSWNFTRNQDQEWEANTTVTLEETDEGKLERLIELLEENDDVQDVYHNAE